jgi:hypothetical protein
VFSVMADVIPLLNEFHFVQQRTIHDCKDTAVNDSFAIHISNQPQHKRLITKICNTFGENMRVIYMLYAKNSSLIWLERNGKRRRDVATTFKSLELA